MSPKSSYTDTMNPTYNIPGLTKVSTSTNLHLVILHLYYIHKQVSSLFFLIFDILVQEVRSILDLFLEILRLFLQNCFNLHFQNFLIPWLQIVMNILLFFEIDVITGLETGPFVELQLQI